MASSSNYDDDDRNKNIRKATGLICKKDSELVADFLADFSAVTVHWLTMLNLIGMAMRSSLYFKSLRPKIIATLISSVVPLHRESPNACASKNIAAPYWTGQARPNSSIYITKRDDEHFAPFVPRIPLGPQTKFFLHFRQKSSVTTFWDMIIMSTKNPYILRLIKLNTA